MPQKDVSDAIVLAENGASGILADPSGVFLSDTAHDTDGGGDDGNGFQSDAADAGGRDQTVIDEAHRRGHKQAVAQDLGLAECDEKRIGDQCHDQQEGKVALPEDEAERSDADQQNARHDVIRLGLFLDKEATHIACHAYNVQYKAVECAEQQIAQAQEHNAGRLDHQKPLFCVCLIGRGDDHGCNNAADLSANFLHNNFSLCVVVGLQNSSNSIAQLFALCNSELQKM